MALVDMLCLANSRKMGGKCIAGLIIEDSRWIRPVSTRPDGHILPTDYRLDIGGEVRILDVYSIDFASSCPKPYHPEDHYYNTQKAILSAPIPYDNLRKVISRRLNDQSELICGTSDRISVQSVTTQNPLRCSLQIITPESLRLNVTTSQSGNRQLRIIFNYSGSVYNLAVTDTQFCARFSHLKSGYYNSSDIKLSENVHLVISLGEPFNGYYFKLVATVVEVDLGRND